MRVLAVVGLKGGVGKTSAAVNLAALAAQSGKRTLLWDLDPQAAATHCLHLKPKLKGGAERLLGGHRDGLAGVARPTDLKRLLVVPADTTLRDTERLLGDARKPSRLIRKLLATMKREVDVIILDCPPGLGALTVVVAENADLLLLPVVPTPLAVRAFESYVEVLADEGTPKDVFAPFLSMIDRRKPIQRRIESDIRKDKRFLGAAIPESSAVERMGDRRVPTVVSSPRSNASQEYRLLWAEAAERGNV